MAPGESSQEEPLTANSVRFRYAAKTMVEPAKSGVSNENSPKGTLQADVFEQKIRPDNVRIFCVIEESLEAVYQKVADDAQEAGNALAKEDNSMCHRLATRKPGKKNTNAKFAGRHKKHQKKPTRTFEWDRETILHQWGRCTIEKRTATVS